MNDWPPNRAQILKAHADLTNVGRKLNAVAGYERRRVWRGRGWMLIAVGFIVMEVHILLASTVVWQGALAGAAISLWAVNFSWAWRNYESRWTQYCYLRNTLPEQLQFLEHLMQLEQEGKLHADHPGTLRSDGTGGEP